MLILDTDHLSALDRGGVKGAALNQKLEARGDEVATTIITAEEQLRGWLAQIRRNRQPHKWISAYQRLQGRIEFFAAGLVLPWDAAAADVFLGLRSQGIRIGTMDLKIASIVLASDAILLSRNLRDFQKIPQLRVEDWLS